jgi:hypothetical protein
MAALALGVLLPYAAVVIANAGRGRPSAPTAMFVIGPWDTAVPSALPAPCSTTASTSQVGWA